MVREHKRTDIVLVCKKTQFLSQIDEELFFNWIGQIPCVFEVKGVHDEIQLHIHSVDLNKDCIAEIYALFDRYKINTKQVDELEGS
jgi:hypothetical protein